MTKGASIKELYYLNQTLHRDSVRQIFQLYNNAVIAICKSRLVAHREAPYYIYFGYNPKVGAGLGTRIGPVQWFGTIRMARAYMEEQFRDYDPQIVVNNELLDRMELAYDHYTEQNLTYGENNRYGWRTKEGGDYAVPLFPRSHELGWVWRPQIVQDLKEETLHFPDAQTAIATYLQGMDTFLRYAEETYDAMDNWFVYKTKTTRKVVSHEREYSDFWRGSSELILPSILGDDPTQVAPAELHELRRRLLLQRDYVPQRINEF